MKEKLMERLKRNIVMTLMVAMIGSCILGNVISVKAEDIPIYKNQLSTNGKWVNYYLNKGEFHYIPIVTTKPGTLYITFRTFCGPNYVRVLDSDFKEIKSDFQYGSSASPEIVDYKIDLEAGTYYLRYEYWNEEGSYSAKATFKEANNNEIESNNTYYESMNVGINKTYTGFLSEQDDVDFYKISITKKQKYIITYRSTDGNGIFTLLDSDLRKIEEKWIYDSDTKTYEKILEPGIYYVSFTRVNGTGIYTFKYNNTTTSITQKNYKVSVPKKFKVKKKKSRRIKLTWKKVTKATGYEIYRSTSKKGKYKKIATISNKNTYINKISKKKKTYYYKIRAIRKIGTNTYKSVYTKAKKAK